MFSALLHAVHQRSPSSSASCYCIRLSIEVRSASCTSRRIPVTESGKGLRKQRTFTMIYGHFSRPPPLWRRCGGDQPEQRPPDQAAPPPPPPALLPPPPPPLLHPLLLQLLRELDHLPRRLREPGHPVAQPLRPDRHGLAPALPRQVISEARLGRLNLQAGRLQLAGGRTSRHCTD